MGPSIVIRETFLTAHMSSKSLQTSDDSVTPQALQINRNLMGLPRSGTDGKTDFKESGRGQQRSICRITQIQEHPL